MNDNQNQSSSLGCITIVVAILVTCICVANPSSSYTAIALKAGKELCKGIVRVFILAFLLVVYFVFFYKEK